MIKKIRKKVGLREPGLTPRDAVGTRNIFCPYYSRCLDIVIGKGWQSWNCGVCEHQSNRAGVREMEWSKENSVAYYELSIKL